ncbi:hypothetical protein NHF46_11650 [Arthrobacter alpinus]|nr:hypothetical protein [Arthrobacter alpinus]
MGGIRIVHSQIQIPPIPEGATPEEIDRIIHTAFLSDLGLGALMLVVFIATGLLLMYEAKLLSDPDLDRMLKGANDRDRLLKAWTEADSQAIREGNLLARRNHQISYSLEKERQHSHEGAFAVREIGKELSVVTQAQILATPTATLMTQIPRKDRPYRPAATLREMGEGSPRTSNDRASLPALSLRHCTLSAGEGCSRAWPTHGPRPCTRCTHGYSCTTHGRHWTGTLPIDPNH